MKDAGYRAELEAAKRASTTQLLMKCARLVNERALARVPVPAGMPAPRPAHTALFPHISLEGTRVTELARRIGVTKQAVGQLVDELVEMGVVERRPDPEDARARLVAWTPRGREALLHGLSTLRQVEAELSEVIGARRWAALHDALLALHDHLAPEEAEPARPAPLSEAPAPRRGKKREEGRKVNREAGRRGDERKRER